jgi:hypothetical protein
MNREVYSKFYFWHTYDTENEKRTPKNSTSLLVVNILENTLWAMQNTGV